MNPQELIQFRTEQNQSETESEFLAFLLYDLRQAQKEGNEIGAQGIGAITREGESRGNESLKAEEQREVHSSLLSYILDEIRKKDIDLSSVIAGLESVRMEIAASRQESKDSEPMDEERLRRVPTGVEAYWRGDRSSQDSLTEQIVEFADRGVMDLAVTACGEALPRLLRYPILCKSLALRDELYGCLHRTGLGPSRMYPAPLPVIPGLAEPLGNQGPFPNAQAFAERILTLPTHDGVRSRDVERMARVFREVCC